MEKIKENDVFHFRYNQKTIDARGGDWQVRHCFEGTLVARLTADKKILLVDTFWGIKGDGVSGSQTEWRKKGTLQFYVNLNDIELIKDYETVYYNNEDLYILSEQHACVPSCIHNFKRKGVERSNKKMLETINEKIREEKKKIDWAVDSLQRLAVDKMKIENGDLTVYL